MILVDNYFLAILCCVICCACWALGKYAEDGCAKQWSFELFYWDLTVGLFLTALLGAVTLGSMGSEGRTFFRIWQSWTGLAFNMHSWAVLCGTLAIYFLPQPLL